MNPPPPVPGAQHQSRRALHFGYLFIIICSLVAVPGSVAILLLLCCLIECFDSVCSGFARSGRGREGGCITPGGGNMW